MKKATLVILAAGMGSRYGGLKQIDPVDKNGHIIIDFSIYDALQAGFSKVVFIIKHAIEKDFKEAVGHRIEKLCEVEYVYQELDKLPEGFSVPEGRVKPWGTGHALLCCKDVLDGPFAVINADDFYGRDAFEIMYRYLMEEEQEGKTDYAMVGYPLTATLTENGHVARGVCVIENGCLSQIAERTMIRKGETCPAYSEDGGETWTDLSNDSWVSMNFWGFNTTIFPVLEKGMVEFLEKSVANPLKSEYLIPGAVGQLLEEKAATVKVLKTSAKWFGVTYQADKPYVMEALAKMEAEGEYPENF
ncbi:MAG: nucleotidyltransferase [Oscillospiraceae bacterium]|nr:nucleotidyltransferase [Oscillospiraceae bacterium]MBQ8732225.1 nucleotidyltransferase [Oscillospiraceae bacterium]